MKWKISGGRTQVSTWFDEVQTSHLMNISRRLDWISGLSVAWDEDEDTVNKFDGRSEPYQVSHY